MKRTISAEVGKGSVNHNSRKFQAENVDGSRTHLNIDYCNERIQTVYHGGESRLRAAESVERYHLGVAAPIVAEGDLMGCVMLLMGEHDAAPTESEQTLAQTFAGFLGKQMES